jgi:hypothetical protein
MAYIAASIIPDLFLNSVTLSFTSEVRYSLNYLLILLKLIILFRMKVAIGILLF